jgi:hypothetical protein
MAHRDSTVPVQTSDERSRSVEQEVVALCHNLLARPADRRGPFVIPDRELKGPIGAKGKPRIRLASAT